MNDPLVLATFAAAIAAWVGAYFAWKSRKDARRIYELQPKRDVLRRFVGNLHFATSQLKKHERHVDLLAAMNEIVVVFGEDEAVVDKLQVLKRNVDNADNFLPLVRAMAVVCDLNLVSCPINK